MKSNSASLGTFLSIKFTFFNTTLGLFLYTALKSLPRHQWLWHELSTALEFDLFINFSYGYCSGSLTWSCALLRIIYCCYGFSSLIINLGKGWRIHHQWSLIYWSVFFTDEIHSMHLIYEDLSCLSYWVKARSRFMISVA